MKKQLISCLIAIVMIISALPEMVFAEDPVLYVNLGDSIAWGRIENEKDYPNYNWEEDSYSGLFATHLGTTRTSYARRGMQTTDVLYMIDDDFRNDVDNGKITVDTWHWYEYPPFDKEVSLEEIKNNITDADYISLCVGICDYISYPGDVKDARMEKLGDIDSTLEDLTALLKEGKITKETFNALNTFLDMGTDMAMILVNYILEIFDGYMDYTQYYGRIVKELRNANSDGTIILLGNYIPSSVKETVKDIPGADAIITLLDNLMDSINITVKKAAVDYDCLYIDTIGVDSDWHPTVSGHQQIYERIVSVVNGEKTYAGDIDVLKHFSKEVKIAEKVVSPIKKMAKRTVSTSREMASLMLKEEYREIRKTTPIIN